MTRPSPTSDLRFGSTLVRAALAIGLIGGLVEGAGHLLVQRLGILENSWYEIIWISAIFNGLLVGATGIVMAAAVRFVADGTLARRAAVFVVVCAAVLPVFALLLKDWLATYAIASLTLGLAVAATRWLGRRPPDRLHWLGRQLPIAAAATLVALIVIQGGLRWREHRILSQLPAARADAPNVLLIVIDALRADHLSSYGATRRTSPTLDRLASEGALFESAFSASSYTLPSHASLLTGLAPYEHGVEWQTSKVHATATYPFLPETLQDAGYETAAFSANTFWFSREHGFGRGFARFEDYFHSVPDMVLRTAYGRIVTRALLGRFGWNDIPARKRATDVNHAALKWIEQRTDRPFFVMLNYMDVHDPYRPPEPYRSRFSATPSPGGQLNWLVNVPDSLPPDELQGEIDAYDGAIAYVDAQVDQLLAALSARPGRDLLVIVTSDHGEEFQEHGGLLHARNLYRETIHVPLILWRPGQVPAGLRVTRPVTNAGVPATILDLIGWTEAFPGPSLADAWTAPDTVADWPAALSELTQRPWASESAEVQSGSIRSLATDDWHYIEHTVHGAELFELRGDPLDQHDLASDSTAQETIRQLQQELRRRVVHDRHP